MNISLENYKYQGEGLKQLNSSFPSTGYSAGRDYTFANHQKVHVFRSNNFLNFACGNETLAVKLNTNGTINQLKWNHVEHNNENTFPKEVLWVKLAVAQHFEHLDLTKQVEKKPVNVNNNNSLPIVAAPTQKAVFDNGSFVTLKAVLEVISRIDLKGSNSRKVEEVQKIGEVDNNIYEYLNGSKLMHIIKALDFNKLNQKFYDVTSVHGNRFDGRHGEKNYVVSRNGNTITVGDSKGTLVFSYDIDKRTGHTSNYKNQNGDCKKEQINWELNKSAMFTLIPKKDRERQLENALRFEFNKENYYVWRNGDFIVVEAQSSIAVKTPTNKIGLMVGKNGQVTSVKVNVEKPILMKNVNDFEEYLAKNPDKSQLLYAALKQAFIVSSQYKPNAQKTRVYADVVRSGIKKFPYILLNLFMKEINKMHSNGDKDPYMTISFMQDNLKKAEGVDDTGLSRDFISELAEAMCQYLGFKIDKNTQLYYPSEERALSEEKKDMYIQFGQLLKLCHNTKQSFVTGVLFDSSLFIAICNLSYSSLKKDSYQDLKSEEKSSIIKKIATTYNKPEVYEDEFEMILRTSNPNFTPKKLNEQAVDLYFKDAWVSSDYEIALQYLKIMDADDELPDKYSNEDVKQQFMVTAEEDPKVQIIERQAEAIFYMAKGFVELANPGSLEKEDIEDAWMSMNHLNPRDVKFNIAEKIQGSINREAFSKYFEESSVFQIARLRRVILEWINDPKTTDQEIKKMLQNLSGASAIVKGKTYKFKPFNLSDIFDTHTCYFYTNVNVDFLLEIKDDAELLKLFKSLYVGLGSNYNRA